MTSRISCNAHDYFEIICMRRSRVMVTTYKGDVFSGTAVNIILDNKQEILMIKNEEETQYIALTDIQKLQAIGNRNEQDNFLVQW